MHQPIFYYHIGYLSEARHCAYEALVYFPYSHRVMQLLVKIHLISGEYKAAENYLKILDKGFLDQSFVKEFMPYISDTLMVSKNEEFAKKRNFAPGGHELGLFIQDSF
ncbi:MAG: hypothetical protein HC906_19840 [Bacteroidales bacterium]|nr:hypothetical protein [Bacteroidales bacterium]